MRTPVIDGQSIEQFIPANLRGMFYKNAIPQYKYAIHNGLDPYGFSTEGLALYLPLWALKNNVSIRSVDAYGHDCPVTNALWTPQGRTFAGADNIDITSMLSTVASDTTGTLMGWFNGSDMTPAGSQGLIIFGDADATELVGLLIQVTTGKLRGWCYDAGVQQWDLTTDVAPAGNNICFHAALTHNGTAPILYVNGVAVAQTFDDLTDKTTWLNDLTGVDVVKIGEADFGVSNLFLTGGCNEAWIYEPALSAGEVLDNYKRTAWRYQ